MGMTTITHSKSGLVLMTAAFAFAFAFVKVPRRVLAHRAGGGGAKGAAAPPPPPPPQPRNIGFFDTKMDPSLPSSQCSPLKLGSIMKLTTKIHQKCPKTGLSAAICTRSRPFFGRGLKLSRAIIILAPPPTFHKWNIKNSLQATCTYIILISYR